MYVKLASSTTGHIKRLFSAGGLITTPPESLSDSYHTKAVKDNVTADML